MKNQLQMDDPQKHALNKRRHFTIRINLFFFCTFMLFSVLIVRLALLQFVESKELKAAEAQNTKMKTPIAPIRGNIFDRNGAPIAYTTSTQSLFFRIEVDQNKDEVVLLAKKLADLFAALGSKGQKPLTAEDIIKEMDVGYDLDKNPVGKPSYYWVPRRLKSGLTKDEIAYISERRDELKWLEIMEESIRTYNADGNDRLAVQLIGYMRPYSTAREPKSGLDFYKQKAAATDTEEKYLDTEYVGYDGLELMYQDELRGQNGLKTYPVNASQKIIGKVSLDPPKKGNNLILSIDKDVQLATQRAITEQLAWLKSGEARASNFGYAPYARSGYAVAMEVKTGKVVAMASMPDYDPNKWTGGIPLAEYNQIKQFVNNGTIRPAYPDYPENELAKHPNSIVYMGSTIKPLSVLIGMNEGLFGLNDRYPDNGIFYFGKDNAFSIRNSDSHAYGMINAQLAVQYSSNTFMSAMIGNPLYLRSGTKAPEIWEAYLNKFGLGVSTGSGLPYEFNGYSEFKTNTKETTQSRMIYASWGQNEKYTTLQLAQYAATLANRGKRLKPQFVDEIRTYDNETVVKKFEPEVLEETTFPKANWDAVFKGMSEVFVTKFDDFPYKFARKTGTSTQSVAGKTIDNAVFIAFAPLENPTLAVAVVIPEGGFGSWGAAPVARKMFDAYDQYVGLTGVPKGAPKNDKTGQPR